MSVSIGNTTYDSFEWENIPSIIPRAFNHAGNMLRSIQEWISRKDAEEPIASINAKIQNLNRQFTDQLKESERAHERTVAGLQNQFKEVYRELEILKEKPEITEAVVQTELTSKDLEDASDLSDEEFSEGEDFGYEERPNFEGDFISRTHNSKNTDVQRARMYSLKTLKFLIYKYLNRSHLKSRFYSYKNQAVPAFYKKLAEVQEDWKNNDGEAQVEFKRIHEKFEYYHSNIQKLYTEVESKLNQIVKWSEKVDSKIGEHNNNLKDLKILQEELEDNLSLNKEGVKRVDDRLSDTSKDIKEELRKRIDALKKIHDKDIDNVNSSHKDASDAMYQKLSETNDSLLANIASSISEVSAECSAQIKENTADIDQQIYEYRKIHESDFENYNKEFNDFRSGIAEFNKKMQMEFKKLRIEFDRWISTVMEPAHVSEARIFSVEAKIKEEETARHEMLHFTKDVIKKLIYSLEQLQLLIHSDDVEENKVLFMKRLAFLKKLISLGEDTGTRPATTEKRMRALSGSSDLRRLPLTSHSRSRNM